MVDEKILKIMQEDKERRKQFAEAYERKHGEPYMKPRPDYYRKYDGPLDLSKITQPELQEL
ncbi:hypothetical protein JCM10213v2_002154 [Rhodosporidiobolus nylandii]